MRVELTMLKGGVMHLLGHCQPTWLGILRMRTCEVDEMYFRILGRKQQRAYVPNLWDNSMTVVVKSLLFLRFCLLLLLSGFYLMEFCQILCFSD